MKRIRTAAVVILALGALLEGVAHAQSRPTTRGNDQAYITARTDTSGRAGVAGEPDVLLDIPNLSVEEITLEVDDVQANVSLDARLANMLKLTAGADVSINKVKLTIKGVQAQVLLVVRLETVARIIDRTLTTIDRNPQILTQLLSTVDNAVGTVGDVANNAIQSGLLTSTVNALGQTVTRTVDQTGNILERTVDKTGNLVREGVVGSVKDLKVLEETRNAAGDLVRTVRDSSGKVIEYTTNSAGKIIGSRVVGSSLR